MAHTDKVTYELYQYSMPGLSPHRCCKAKALSLVFSLELSPMRPHWDAIAIAISVSISFQPEIARDVGIQEVATAVKLSTPQKSISNRGTLTQ